MKQLYLVLMILLASASVSPAQPGQWTWMQGSSNVCEPSPSEPHCGYAFAHWTDTTGNFWVNVMGGLWKYDPVINNWNAAHPSGLFSNIAAPKGVFDSVNTPGYVLNGAFTWTTPDNILWLFGGAGGCSNFWKYSIALDQWAWMGTYTTENYGIKGVPDTANCPGCSAEANAAWVDSAGDLWLFGAGPIQGNNIWKYEVSSGIWTWMSGSNDGDSGNYGPVGVPSVDYYPSSRWTNFYWKDESGNFWIGLGHDGSYSATDVWRFNPFSLEWTWMSGSPNAAICDPVGAPCDTSHMNQIGGRFENRTTWRLSDSFILTYAGQSCNANFYNDLWAYLPLESKWIKLAEYPVNGHYGTVGVSSPLDYPKCRHGAAGFLDKNNNQVWVFSGRTLNAYTDGNDLWKYEIDWDCLPPSATGILDQPKVISAVVYPNPFHSTTTLLLSDDLSKGNLKIFNLFGEQVGQQKVSFRSTIVERNNLPQGLYSYQLSDNRRVIATGKILIE